MKKGFTLIELLAVIVVLAILALVVTPIVLNIVENAQTGSDERSLEQYAKVMQTTYYELKMKDTSLTMQDYLDKVDTVSGVSLTYNGSKVICSDKVSKEVDGVQTIELRNCTVDGRGYYNFISGKAEKVGENSLKLKEYYENGEVIYFDVSTGKVCTEEQYKKSYDETIGDYLNSKTGYNGIANSSCIIEEDTPTTVMFNCTKTDKTEKQNSCLKFYAFNDKKGREILNLILDHNTTSIADWNSSGSNENGPKEVIEQLYNDTELWKGTIEPSNYSMDQTGQQSNAKYIVDYSGYKSRLITANEIAMITGKTGWDETTAGIYDLYYFHDLSDVWETGRGEICASTGCKYGWLYDRTYTSCTNDGCLNNSDVYTLGYWTASSTATSVLAWSVESSGLMDYGRVCDNDLLYTFSFSGVRPVITISK